MNISVLNGFGDLVQLASSEISARIDLAQMHDFSTHQIHIQGFGQSARLFQARVGTVKTVTVDRMQD